MENMVKNAALAGQSLSRLIVRGTEPSGRRRKLLVLKGRLHTSLHGYRLGKNHENKQEQGTFKKKDSACLLFGQMEPS